MPTPHHPSAAVRRTLSKLGADIHDARRRRQLPMAVVAERALTSRSTMQRVEAGDTSVGIYAAVLQALGLLDGRGEIADISRDSVGQALGLAAARSIIKDVALVTATWREAAKEAGARSAEITRMASAFEHDDLKRALQS